MTDKRASLEAILPAVSRETFDSLVELEAQLNAWNQRINLVSDTTVEDAWRRHILDSAQLLALAPDKAIWADLGTGGGFPGLVVAIVLAERSGASVTLVESNTRKTAFLHHVVGLFGLPATIASERIEQAVTARPAPEIVTARALAPLPKLLGLAAPWLSAGARGLFHKGRDYRRELDESTDKFGFDLIEHASSVDRAGVILDVTGFRKRSDP